MTKLSITRTLACVTTTDPAQAKVSYEKILGLAFSADEVFALVFKLPGAMLRISKVKELTSALYTVLGWEVADIHTETKALAQQGFHFEHYPGLTQDETGLCAFPNGDQVAWFKDPDGNILSLTQFG